MKTVQDIFNSKPKPFNFIQPDALVIDALNMLNSVNLSYLIVMDGDEYKGVFSERDYSRNVILKGRASNTAKVSEVMTTDLPVVDPDDSIEHCMDLINLHKTRYLLAFEGNHFVGIITIHDLLRQVIGSKEGVYNESAASKLLDTDEGGRVY